MEGRDQPDRTQSRVALPSNLERVNAAAKQAAQTRFTALLHHIDEDALLRAFRRQKRQASAGVDGVTVPKYEEELTDIPAALITGIRSDLPGQITAQVTENIYDTPTGRGRLVPQGARLIGVYDSEVAFGQSRVLLVWTRLIMPTGRSIVLERQQGADAEELFRS